MWFASDRYPELHIERFGVRFRSGLAEVTSRVAIEHLLSPWMQRRGVRLATEQDLPAPQSAPEEQQVGTVPDQPEGAALPEGTTTDVLAWVGDDPDRARQALAAEQARDKPRSSLTARLDRIARTQQAETPDDDPAA